MAAAVQERFDAIELANPPERVPITLPSAREPGAALAVAALGFFVVTLDALVVNVALPAIGHDLGGGITGLQWVVDGYTLMFAALLLSAGVLSDRIGARQAYGAGLGLFVIASAACGLAPQLGVLVAARPVVGGFLTLLSWRLIFFITQVGGALAIALFGALVANPDTFLSGLQVSLVIAAVLLLGTVVASLQLRASRER